MKTVLREASIYGQQQDKPDAHYDSDFFFELILEFLVVRRRVMNDRDPPASQTLNIEIERMKGQQEGSRPHSKQEIGIELIFLLEVVFVLKRVWWRGALDRGRGGFIYAVLVG